jgi:hypothetical protein
MDKILVLIGDATVGWKLHNHNLKNFDWPNFELILEESPSKSDLNAELFSLSQYIRKSDDIKRRAELLFLYNLAANFFNGYSLKIKLLTILFGKYKVRNLEGFKLFMRNILRPRMLVLMLVSFYGLLRLPRDLLIKLLAYQFPDVDLFSKYIAKIDPKIVLFFSSGYDNFNFLIDITKENVGTKYLFVINNWDNPSSKSFISSKFDKIFLWNHDQIDQIKKLNKISSDKLSIIGSITADIAYSRYLSSNKKPNVMKRSLLIIGQQNAFDELSEISRIQDLLTNLDCYYKEVIYRPHPISGKQIKSLARQLPYLENLKINDSKDIDLRQFDGIISFPTTFLLEAILSKRPLIVYTPKNSFFRLEPRTMWKYNHFDHLRTMKQVEVVKSLEKLKPFLISGLPDPKNLNLIEFDEIFPRNLEPFYARLKDKIETLEK